MNHIIFAVCMLLFGPVYVQAQKRIVDLTEVNAVVDGWTEAHNEKDLSLLEEFYAEELIFYTKIMPKKNCLAIKSKRLQSPKFFYQQIITKPVVKVYDTEIMKVTFVRQIISGTDVTDHEAYLLLKRIDGKLKIIGESHLLEDRKAKFVPDIGRELKSSTLSESELLVANDLPSNQAKSEQVLNSDDDTFVWSWTLMVVIVLIGLVTLFRKYQRGGSMGWLHSANDWRQEAGLAFEKFVVTRFDRQYFKLLEWTSDKIIDGVYARSVFNPDLHYAFKSRNHVNEFAVECKYRRRLFNGQFELEERQLENYRRYGREKGIPVFIALGIGGRPSRPKALYMIPLSLFAATTAIGYETLRDYYNSPEYSFFLKPDTAEARWFRK